MDRPEQHTCRQLTARRHGSITMWNLLALAAIILGGLATLGAGQLYLHHWVESGIQVPIGDRYAVELPYGTTLVYYESTGEVPQRTPLLKVMDSYGTYAATTPVRDDEHSYRAMFSGRSGRATHTLEIDEPGTFTIACSAADYLSADDMPADDRISLFKEPNTLAEARAAYKTMLIVGGSITAALALGLYLMHFAALRRKHTP